MPWALMSSDRGHATTAVPIKVLPPSTRTLSQDSAEFPEAFTSLTVDEMPVQGLYVEPVEVSSSKFRKYESKFSGRLLKLYTITYSDHMLKKFANDMSGIAWNTSLFFHGTGHCGCLGRRVSESSLSKVKSDEWCGNVHCATQGILNHGHLRTQSCGGHFFSPNVGTAEGYARGKSAGQQYLPFFICKARFSGPRTQDICSVMSDRA
ncbi:hypothetical protein BGZ98_003715 [Dissophora globulifera]|nr:hypothetical protein BGZ98_003715 [Dissophora globulifera]